MKLLKITLFLCLVLPIISDLYSDALILAAKTEDRLTQEQIADMKKRRDNKLNFDRKCDEKLLRSFNLFGRKSSVPQSLEFCPTVINSCCTAGDQIAIYDNWFSSRELETINRKFSNFTAMLESFMEVAEVISDGAGKVLENMADVRTNECKLAARRILSYQIEDLKGALLKIAEEAFDFMRQTYKGFYCSLCDADEHQFISRNSKVITVNEKFCRSIITNTLTSVIYYKVHFPSYINLLSTFAATCDINGKFVQARVPAGVFEEPDSDEEETIDECFKNRNDPIWLDSCQEICQKWNPGQLDEFFLPNINQIVKATEYLENRSDKFAVEDREKRRVLKEEKGKSIKKVNKGNKKNNSKIERKLEQPLNPNYLIAEYINGTLPYYTDNRGYPLNRTNFTNFGSNLTAQAYVDYIESLSSNSNKAQPRIDPESMIVYLSQNISITPSLGEYTIEVEKNGTDFYRGGQFTRFDLELISGILPSGQAGLGKTERKLYIDKYHKKMVKKEKKLKESKKHKREEKRKLKSVSILKFLTFLLSLCFVKI